MMELEVIVGTYECSIIGYSFDLLSKKPVLRKKYCERDHVGCVKCAATGGRYLASGGTDEAIKLYNMRKHTEIGSLLHHQGTITALTFYKDSHLLSCSEDGTICIWKCGGTWDCLHTLTGHKHPVSSISVHPSGRLALSVGKDRSVRTWNLLTGRAAFTLRLPRAADLVQWNPIGSQYVLAVGSTLLVYNLETGEPSTSIEVGRSINAVAFIKDDVLAIGGDCPNILIYSTVTGEKLASLEGHANRVKGLALSPDQTLLFSASSDGCIKVWTLSDQLESSCCICSTSTGCRLTCITVLLLEHSLGKSSNAEQRTHTKEKAEKDEGPTEKGEESECDDGGKDNEGEEANNDTILEEAENEENLIAQKVKQLEDRQTKPSGSNKHVLKSRSSIASRKRRKKVFVKTKSKKTKLSTNSK